MSDSFIETSKCVVRVWVVCNSSIRRFTGACACNDTAKGIYVYSHYLYKPSNTNTSLYKYSPLTKRLPC